MWRPPTPCSRTSGSRACAAAAQTQAATQAAAASSKCLLAQLCFGMVMRGMMGGMMCVGWAGSKEQAWLLMFYLVDVLPWTQLTDWGTTGHGLQLMAGL